MRTVTTVILRLLRNDHAAPLRGTLQTLDEPEPISFKDEGELLSLLRRFATPDHAMSQETSPHESQSAAEPR